MRWEKATTKTYRFEVLGEEPLGGAKELRQGKSRAYAVFERVAIRLDWSDGLKVEILPVAVEASGEAVESVQQTLGDQLSIPIQKQPFVWQLKRSSKTVVEVQGEAVRLLVDRTGAVHRLTYRPTIAYQHLVGFGERFDTVDQMGKELLCRIAEKFTRQGENSYLPIPFFMTDAGLGWFSSTQRRLWFDGRDGVALTFETDPNHPQSRSGGWWVSLRSSSAACTISQAEPQCLPSGRLGSGFPRMAGIPSRRPWNSWRHWPGTSFLQRLWCWKRGVMSTPSASLTMPNTILCPRIGRTHTGISASHKGKMA